MKKKAVWLGCLILGLFLAVIVIHRIDNMKVCGIRVVSGDALNEIASGLSSLSNLQTMNKLMTMDGQAVPYVQEENTFYISQSVETAEYAGALRAVGDDYDIYLEKDELLQDKQTAISEGHVFKLWFVSDEVYVTANVIFTGLPVICINTEEETDAENAEGDLVIQNPDDDDINGLSVKYSLAQIKENSNTETVTLKLFKKEFQEERNLSLLGLGKHTSWKLYPIYDKDESMLRAILAAYVWNAVCDEENLQRPFGYAEVIVDGKYRGLHLVSPKVGTGYLNLQPDEQLYKCEEMQEEIEAEQIDTGNCVNYNIYLQAVCAVRNGQTEYYFIGQKSEKAGYTYKRMPEDYKYVFGLYPKEIGWQSVTAAESIMRDDVYDQIYETTGSSFESAAEERWRSLRDHQLSTENLLKQGLLYSQELMQSGYVARNCSIHEYNNACEEVFAFVIKRMNYLDQYYQ